MCRVNFRAKLIDGSDSIALIPSNVSRALPIRESDEISLDFVTAEEVKAAVALQVKVQRISCPISNSKKGFQRWSKAVSSWFLACERYISAGDILEVPIDG